MLQKSTLRNYLVPGLILIALLNGLIKSITGIRYFPLAIDFVILLILAFIGLTLIDKVNPRIGFIDILGLSFVLLAFVWMFHPNIPSFEAGLEGFRKFAFMICGFFIGRYWFRTIKSVQVFINILLVASTLIALYGIKQYLLPTGLDFRLIELSTGSPTTYLMGGHIRAFSTLSGPFHLGILLVGSTLLLVSLYLTKIKRFRKILLIMIPIQVIALVMTVTKSNMFALIAGSLVVVFLLTKQPFRTLIRLIMIGIIGIICILGVFVATANNPEFRTVHQGIQDLIRPISAPTFQFRLELWQKEVVPLAKDSPWIGYGTGSAGEGLAFYFENTGNRYISAHNQYLKIILELGIPGFLIFTLFFGISVFLIIRNQRKITNPTLRAFNAWAVAYAVSFLLSGLAGSMLDAYPINLIFWITLGIATRVIYLQQSVIQPNQKIPAFDDYQLSARVAEHG